jgi:hypothetical protein
MMWRHQNSVAARNHTSVPNSKCKKAQQLEFKKKNDLVLNQTQNNITGPTASQ